MSKRLPPFLILLAALLFAFGPLAWAQTPGERPVPGAPDQICPLPLGSLFPALTLETVAGKPFDLSAALKAKPTILIYFRGGW
jgi:hypothetical protein